MTLRALSLPAFLLLAACTPAMVSALTGAGMGALEATVRAEAAANGADPSAPAWRAAIAAAQKADAKLANNIAEAERKRDVAADEQRKREHAEVMAALRGCGAHAADAGAERGSP